MRTMVNELSVLGLSLDGERIELETLARLLALGGEAGVRAALLRQLSASSQRMLALLQAPARDCLAVMRARQLAASPTPRAGHGHHVTGSVSPFA